MNTQIISNKIKTGIQILLNRSKFTYFCFPMRGKLKMLGFVYSVAQLCITVCSSTDYNMSGSSVTSRAEYWSGLHSLLHRDLPNPGTELMTLGSSALAGRFFTTSATSEVPSLQNVFNTYFFSSLRKEIMLCEDNMLLEVLEYSIWQLGNAGVANSSQLFTFQVSLDIKIFKH